MDITMGNDSKPGDRSESSLGAPKDRLASGDARPDRVLVISLRRPRARSRHLVPLPDERSDLSCIAVLGYN